jgi:hypothetical protein
MSLRQEELRRLQIEKDREGFEQVEDEIDHPPHPVDGARAVKSFPKGLLRDDDLDYVPEDYRNAILNTQTKPKEFYIFVPTFVKRRFQMRMFNGLLQYDLNNKMKGNE